MWRNLPSESATASAHAAAESWPVEPLAAVLLAACLQAIVILARYLRQEVAFTRAKARTQRIIDAIHRHLLTGYGDFRVTLLLPFRDADGADNLRPFLRNEGCLVGGRLLRVSDTQQTADGVAGLAWIKGDVVMRGISKAYEECVNEQERGAYRGKMHATHEFLTKPETGRNPRFVLAVPLRIGSNRQKAGILCIDGKSSSNIMGGAVPFDDDSGGSNRATHEAVRARLLQDLVTSCSSLVADRGVAPLYRCAGEAYDDAN
jgi:hypothetical protein